MKGAGTVVVVALVLAMCRLGAADTLQLEKGDNLSGKLIRFAEGVVHFRTKMAGNVIIPIEEVGRLATDEPVVVKKKDGATLEGPISLDQKQVIIAQGEKSRSVPVDQVETIEPAPKNLAPAGSPLHLSAETGLLWRSGNEDYTDLFGRLRLSTTLDPYLFDADLFLERADADEFPRWLTASTRLRIHPDRLWQPALGLDFERDTDKALLSRAGLNFGLVRAFPDLGLEAEAGLQAETARWRHEPSDDGLNLRVALRYTRQIFENGAFTNSLSFTPSLINPERLRAQSESSLAFPFAQRIKLKLNLLIDYEDYPQLQDLPKWRTTIGASFLWDF
ncbi:MAG: DUF481 domain-containing protein [Candidatus Hydrogenedentes bacterium]|nr:DUF481 domain-containing protein [Candidatus Hydrogenedentota bacterium]